ncbi:hypothetical protein, partial [Mesorhizobium sp. M7A.F.Ca.AU.001.01.1.1]|uniref:hypothetical protein n=1 Tax=Mesorhizobium sp. M7A.F.Ca.AU.001.01.1.1 TaxID=2496675 RepID=UPI0019D4B69A
DSSRSTSWRPRIRLEIHQRLHRFSTGGSSSVLLRGAQLVERLLDRRVPEEDILWNFGIDIPTSHIRDKGVCGSTGPSNPRSRTEPE